MQAATVLLLLVFITGEGFAIPPTSPASAGTPAAAAEPTSGPKNHNQKATALGGPLSKEPQVFGFTVCGPTPEKILRCKSENGEQHTLSCPSTVDYTFYSDVSGRDGDLSGFKKVNGQRVLVRLPCKVSEGNSAFNAM